MTFATAMAGTGPMCTLYQLTLSDATVKRWTSYNTDIVYDGNTYTAIPGLSHTKKPRRLSIVNENVTVKLPPDSTYVDWALVQDSQLLRNSTIIIVQTSVADPDNDYRVFFRGRNDGSSRDATEGDMKFVSNFQSRNVIIPELSFSTDCPKWFTGGGTPGCSLVLAALKQAGAVEAGSTAVVINDATNLTQADDYFLGGFLELTSGTYSGEQRRIVKYVTGVVTLEYGFSGAPSVADTFDANPHCRHTYARCSDFSNTDECFAFQYAPREEDIRV